MRISAGVLKLCVVAIGPCLVAVTQPPASTCGFTPSRDIDTGEVSDPASGFRNSFSRMEMACAECAR